MHERALTLKRVTCRIEASSISTPILEMLISVNTRTLQAASRDEILWVLAAISLTPGPLDDTLETVPKMFPGT